MSQKGHGTMKIKSHNWRNIFVLPFKSMATMSHLFFHSHECQKIQTINPYDKILNLNLNLKPLKVETYCIKRNEFC
jgi:hypothetical protein